MADPQSTLKFVQILRLYFCHLHLCCREAKGIHQSLKELLKKKEPFDKETDFQRKK